jgi:hypothetical protein
VDSINAFLRQRSEGLQSSFHVSAAHSNSQTAKDGLKASLKRLSRLVQIRDTYVSAAEAGVKHAEAECSGSKLQTGNRRDSGSQAGIAYLQTATGQDIQNTERYIRALEHQRKLIQ